MWPFNNRTTRNIGNHFRMYAETDIEHFRADTFYDKEPETLAWIRSFNPRAVFLDIGANVGIYSLYAASCFPLAIIYPIEPQLENYIRLAQNKLLNEFRNMHPQRMAIGDNTNIAEFFVKEAVVGETGGQLYEPEDEYEERFEPKRLDKIFTLKAQELIGHAYADRPIYIKIDVDGHEESIISALEVGKSHNIRSILVEVNKDVSNLNTINQHMKALGLKPDNRFNYPDYTPHSSERRNGNPVNMVYSRR